MNATGNTTDILTRVQIVRSVQYTGSMLSSLIILHQAPHRRRLDR